MSALHRLRYVDANPILRLWVYGTACVLVGLGLLGYVSVSPAQVGGGPNSGRIAAIQLLKQIHAAQHIFRSACCIDTDGDENGEYGYLAELAGEFSGRGTPAGLRRLTVPALPAKCNKIQSRPGLPGGVLLHKGYIFMMFLPDAEAKGVPECPTGGTGDAVIDQGMCEKYWCCYAWPKHRNTRGRETLFINQWGEMLATDSDAKGYEGFEHPPKFGAAFLRQSARTLSSNIAFDEIGGDGQPWVVVR